MKYLFATIACLAIAGPAHAQLYGVKYSPPELPNDIDKPFVTVIGHPQDPRFQLLRSWFHGPLRELRERTHYTELPTDSEMYRARYAETAPASLPSIRIQTPDGTVLNEITPPMSAEALGNGITSCFRREPEAIEPPPPAADHRYLALAALVTAAAVAGAYQQFKRTK